MLQQEGVRRTFQLSCLKALKNHRARLKHKSWRRPSQFLGHSLAPPMAVLLPPGNQTWILNITSFNNLQMVYFPDFHVCLYQTVVNFLVSGSSGSFWVFTKFHASGQSASGVQDSKTLCHPELWKTWGNQRNTRVIMNHTSLLWAYIIHLYMYLEHGLWWNRVGCESVQSAKLEVPDGSSKGHFLLSEAISSAAGGTGTAGGRQSTLSNPENPNARP